LQRISRHRRQVPAFPRCVKCPPTHAYFAHTLPHTSRYSPSSHRR
jgi:hypothetical protein